MTITTITNARDLPRTHNYTMLTGELADCIRQYEEHCPWLAGHIEGYCRRASTGAGCCMSRRTGGGTMMSSKVTECVVQAVLMRFLMGVRNHLYVLPNSNGFYGWEADLLSVTKSLLIHEFEVKISLADYRRDAAKYKHRMMRTPELNRYTPNYFWYATSGFDIDPPANAGWARVYLDDKHTWRVEVEKEAPRLHAEKMSDVQEAKIAHLLSWRIANVYDKFMTR